MNEPAIGLEGLLAVGMGHRSADVELRERYALDALGRRALAERLAAELGLTRTVVLSTCNRTEVYALADADGEPRALAADVVAAAFPGLSDPSAVLVRRGFDAVFHLFRLAAGLESMVVGETEILGQLRQAFEESADRGDPGRVLRDVFRQGLMLGKRVRSETRLGRGSLSVAAVAVKLARKIVGSLADKRALIIGAGDTGVLAARHLVAAGTRRLTVLNRTRERAAALAAELGARAGGLEDLGAELEKADVVIGCIARDEPLLDARAVADLDVRTRCFIDLSVPRCFAPDVAEHAGVFLFDVDDLAALVEDNRSERVAQTVEVNDLIVAEVHKFLGTQTFAGMSPLVRDIRAGFDDVTAELRPGRAEDAAFADLLARRLFGVAMEALKRSSRDRFSRELVRAAYESYLARENAP